MLTSQKGTNLAISGVIPYVIVEANGNIFNPGEFFSFYLSLLPKNSTLEGKEGAPLSLTIISLQKLPIFVDSAIKERASKY